MVDLVKIRKKKAKEKEEAAAADEAARPATSAPPVQEPQPPNAERPTPKAAAPQTTDNRPPTTASANKLEAFKQQAGKRRDIASVKTEETQEDHLELLTFVMAREQYAVDIERIIEIVTPRSVTRIPNADSSVVGIISLRGTIVTLVDVRRKLRHDVAGEATPDTRIVVIDFHHELVGFLVDRVLRVVKTTRAAIEPHPVVHAAELDDSIRGVFRTGGALTILLDLDKLLDHRALATSTA
ncbi:MAG TPA: chemotaxis protein CheW [Thermoanaerobaculia bacterium]|nr:chemotaxis protein CheW [Thermoanaerobaculia bacterium]